MEEAKERLDLEKGVKEWEDKQIKVALYFDKSYPEVFKSIPNPPYALFYQGSLPSKEEKIVAVVGARNCSEYGSYLAKEFGATLAQGGVSVVSGMAKGIDGICQRAVCKYGGKSYAILGCGVDICYPTQNKDIYHHMVEHGAVISEYVPGTQPRPALFPPRNRLISGLAGQLVVIEAREKSGTLITVDMALEQGKEVYALPGRVTDALSYGCNQLLWQGANMILSPAHFLQEIQNASIDSARKDTNGEKRIESVVHAEVVDREKEYKNLTLKEQKIMMLLQDRALNISEIYSIMEDNQTSFREWKGVSDILETIFDLMNRGMIKKTAGNCFKI